MSEPRVMPMYNPVPLWDKDSESKYPDVLKMAFRDGSVRIYRAVVEQPAPHTFSEKAARAFERNCFGGYKREPEYVGKHTKK